MTTTTCLDCNTRRPRTGPGEKAPLGTELCNPCYEVASWENTHSDEGHDDGYGELMDICMICHPELVPGAKRTGHTNTVAKSHTSHAGHNHLATPYNRSLCRKSMAAGHGPYDKDNPKV